MWVVVLVALVALPGDQVLTSDPDELARLLGAREIHARVPSSIAIDEAPMRSAT